MQMSCMGIQLQYILPFAVLGEGRTLIPLLHGILLSSHHAQLDLEDHGFLQH